MEQVQEYKGFVIFSDGRDFYVFDEDEIILFGREMSECLDITPTISECLLHIDSI